jgi:hypothetical protein
VRELLRAAIAHLGLSARAYDRVRRKAGVIDTNHGEQRSDSQRHRELRCPDRAQNLHEPLAGSTPRTEKRAVLWREA